jgi:Fic family protein
MALAGRRGFLMQKKTLEPAPAGRLAPGALERISESLEDDGLSRLIERANRDYLYWDKFKHLTMPPGIDAADAWRFLALIRRLKRHVTLVRDVQDRRFWYSQTEEAYRCLHMIDQKSAGTISTAFDAPPAETQKRYLINQLMEEAIASSQIEGASTTTRVAKDMLRTGRKPADYSEQMILNNYKTISRIKELRDEPITPQLIKDLQRSMTDGTLSPDDVGRFRNAEDDIVVTDDYHILHEPPDANAIEGEIDRLCVHANDDSGPFEHPVVRAVVLHFWLAYVHPFVDGNGRTARALFYLYMLKRGYWLYEYLSISRVIKSKRGQYDRAYLYAESGDNDLTYFLMFNLKAIEQAIDELNAYMEKKAQDDSRLQRQLRKDQTLNYRQRAIVSKALKDPETLFTMESHRASHDIAYATARHDLLDLVDKGYLVQGRRGREFVFEPAADLRGKLADL